MKKIKLIILTLTLPLLINSCGAIVKGSALKKTTVENGAIPENIGDENFVLICVLTGKNSRDKYMKKHIEKNYKGKYEFVLREELSSNKYTDKNKYRYLFDYNSGSIQSSGHRNSSGILVTKSLPTSSYYLMDRKTYKYYSSKFSSGYFSKLIQAYAINMEKTRLKNL